MFKIRCHHAVQVTTNGFIVFFSKNSHEYQILSSKLIYVTRILLFSKTISDKTTITNKYHYGPSYVLIHMADNQFNKLEA